MRDRRTREAGEAPFCAFFLSTMSSEEVARTRRCSSSRPMSPRVRLTRGQRGSAARRRAYPAKTPPARTRTALIAILPQNSGEPICSSVELGRSWDRGYKRGGTIRLGLMVAGRKRAPLIHYCLFGRFEMPLQSNIILIRVPRCRNHTTRPYTSLRRRG